MSKKLLNFIGIPTLTFLLFVFESSNPEFFLFELLWSFAISFILWHGNGLIIKVLNDRLPWRENAVPRIIIQVAISAFFTTWLTYFAVKYLYAGIYEAHFSSLVFRKNLFVFLLISILYNAVYTGGYLFNKWRSSVINSEQLERQKIQSELDALKSQISPHFLFNTVNTLIGLIDEDPKKAKEYGYLFSESYRLVLDLGKKELIPISDELKLVNIQKKLYEHRFGKSLIIEFQYDSNVLESFFIPPLSLQMLVENAVKHNRISTEYPLRITISIENERAVIINNLQLKNTLTHSSGTGLKNIALRYRIIADSEISIDQSDSEFKVTLPILKSS